MNVRADQVFSHYRLIEIIGEGGMGVVWKALDTKLSRFVALKFLPEGMAEDAARLARLDREVKVLASLNHPNIVTMHSVEEAHGCKFFTMELIEGRTLGEVIPRNGMRLRNLFKFAMPLVEAVAAAHEKGITHRDLKPSNVMIAREGHVKVLDFGLAKLGPRPRESKTQLTTITGEGKLVGTVAYMSPEQVEAQAVDHRSDIFSIGTILYEMATGEPPFKGGSSVSLASSILRDRPRRVSETRPALPRHFGRIIDLCLAKEPERRYQTARDLSNQLEQLKEELDSHALDRDGSSLAPGGRRNRWAWPAAVGLPVLLTLAWLLGVRMGEGTTPVTSPAATVPGTSLVRFAADGEWAGYPSWAPDGRWVVYAAFSGMSMDLYKKAVDGGSPIRLTHTPTNETWPAWSPDGKTIAFSSASNGRGIYLIGADGGTPWRLAESGRSPSWSPDGSRIAFESNGALYTVPVSGGSPTLVSRGASVNSQPIWTADGRKLIFWHRTSGDVAVVPADGGEPRPIGLVAAPYQVDSLSLAANGRRLYYNLGPFGGDKNLWSVEIDPVTAEPSSRPVQLTLSTTDDTHARVSPDGETIAFTARVVERNLWSFPIDPETGLLGESGEQLTFVGRRNHTPTISPDGNTLVWTSHQSGRGLLYYQRLDEPCVELKLTEEWGRDARETGASFSPDSQQIAYTSTSGGSYQVWRKPCIDCVALQLTQARNPVRDALTAWAPDRDEIAFYSNRAGNWDVWRLTLDEGDEPVQLTESDANEMYPSWSPSGDRIAYSTDGGATGDIWVANRDGSNPRPHVTTPADDAWSAWSHDERHFYFTSNAGGAYNVWMVSEEQTEPRQVTFYDGALFGMPESSRMTKFAVGRGEIVLPLERREGDIYLLELGD